MKKGWLEGIVSVSFYCRTRMLWSKLPDKDISNVVVWCSDTDNLQSSSVLNYQGCGVELNTRNSLSFECWGDTPCPQLFVEAILDRTLFACL
jgi:hypothetical protein